MKVAGPLSGIKVLDFTRLLAGPYCTMMLGDMGAAVIKIESPEKGDESRSWGPPFVGGESAYFLCINRNKKSVTLDLKTPEGISKALDLVRDADVLVENFRPEVMQRLGLSYETVRVINPQLVYCSISAFGSTGPYKDIPAVDNILQGMGGLLGITGVKGGEPIRIGVAITDIGAGMWAAFGILAALLARKEIGHGQKVEASLLSGQVAWLTYMAANFFASDKSPEPMGSEHPNIVPYKAFRCKDGRYLNLAVANETHWQKLCDAAQKPSLRTPEYATNKQRVQQREELYKVLNQTFLEKSSKEWLALLNQFEVPCGPIYIMEEVFSDPQVLHEGMLQMIDHSKAGKIKQIGIPVKLSDTPGAIILPPPLLGQHNEEILGKE
jgi:crotonobetainyl-CoA:carnitine CoA-transferase CaiB-like acyl-CoA transferase